MQNPLENFLLNLAEKIQTEKEYKDIVKDSQNVDVNKDVFAGFIDGISKTIRENVQTPSLSALQEKQDPLDNFLLSLGETLKNIPEKKKEDVSQPVAKDLEQTIEKEKEEPDAFAGFVNNLANILKKEPDEQPVKQKQDLEPVKQKQEPVQDYVNILSSEKKKKEKPSIEKKQEENEETPDIKKFVTNFVSKELEAFKNDLTEKYLKKAAVLSEYAGGGGTNAVQYANGGVMNGDLNVNGHYLSAGVDLLNIFSSGGGGGGGNQTLSFNPSNADLSISGGNTISLASLSSSGGSSGDPAVNSLVHANSGQWNSTYTTLNANSGKYESTYTTLNANSGKYESTYSIVNANSASWEESAEILPTIINYLSTNNVLLSAVTVRSTISAQDIISNNSIQSNSFIANTGFVVPYTGTSRIFSLSDNGKCITFDNASPITASVSSGLPVGFNVLIIQINTGQVELSAGNGVTINSDGSKTKIASQHSSASLISYGSNIFNLAGNLTT